MFCEIHLTIISEADLTMHDKINIVDAGILPVKSIALAQCLDVAKINEHFEAAIGQKLENWMMITHFLQIQMQLRLTTVSAHNSAVIFNHIFHDFFLTNLILVRPFTAWC